MLSISTCDNKQREQARMTKQNNKQTIYSNRHSLLPMHPLGEPSSTSTTMDTSSSSSLLIESSAPYLIPQRRNMSHSFASQHHRIMSYENPDETAAHNDEEDLVKSQSIPIQNHMKRTASEVKLCEDEEMADFRDYIFFSRVIDGIARQQRATESSWLRQENNECLAHIIGTRTGGLEDNQSRKNCRNPALCFNSRVNSNAVSSSSAEQSRQQWINDLPEDGTVDTSSDEIFVMDL